MFVRHGYDATSVATWADAAVRTWTMRVARVSFLGEVDGAGQAAETAKFELSPDTIVIDEQNRPIAPGSDEIGRLAVGGRQPLGYYKDPKKSAEVFVNVDGRRYSIPGDFAKVEEAWRPLYAQLDHNCLNDVPGLENPTSEMLASWILDRFAVPGTQVSSVYVAETCRSACTVYASE